MEDRDLEKLLDGGESDRVEFKPSDSQKDEIRQTICALANDLPNYQEPGLIFVGINDDGNCSHVSVTDELLRTLTDMRSDGNITPMPSITVQKKLIDNCEVAVIKVDPSDAPPVRYKGKTYVRIGPTNRPASVEEERRLSEKRRSKDIPFDISEIQSARVEDLSRDLFQDYLNSALSPDIIRDNERLFENQLISLRFMSPRPEPEPTVLGILILGNDPIKFLPGAYTQFLRIDGDELTDPIKDEKAIEGSISVILRELEEKFKVHNSVAVDIISEDVEQRGPEYPLVAFQQVARNALLHRIYEGTNSPVRVTWFNDRIEVLSPGGPYGQVTKENFGQPHATDYRNPNLAGALKDLGYIQKFGVGLQIAGQSMEENGNPPLEFSIEDTYVLVTMRK